MTLDEVQREALTFLFTDIVGSTELWEQEPARMGEALRASEVLQTRHIEAHGGTAFKNTGDGLAACFPLASDAVNAAGAIQLDVISRDWNDGGLSLRVGLNTGEAESRSSDYFGGAVNLAARVMSTAAGGQVLITQSTTSIARSGLAADFSLSFIGEAWLRGFEEAHQLFQLRHPDMPSEPPRLERSRTSGPQLPAPATNFIGRRTEISELMTTLGRGRLVTLVGPSGVGKSRLGLEVARRVSSRFADGSVWCPLESLATPEQSLHAIAAALDVAEVGDDPLDNVIDHLLQRNVLLLLDNCEHVVSTIRVLVAQIIARCPNVAVLATSQETLRLQGEAVYVVEPLGLAASQESDSPQFDDDGVDLFIDRARSTGAHVDVTPDGRVQIRQLCQQLDGLPLAIELAAARARTMTMIELADAVNERFSLLASRVPSPTAPERHQTLHRAVQWSYDLLTDDERLVFEVFGVFRGGAQFEAVSAVAEHVGVERSDARELLWELVEKSLIRPETDRATTRYNMLASLREFAVDALVERGVLDVCRDAHAAHFLALAEEAERGRAGPDERLWVQAQLSEFDNLRSAVAHALSTGDLDTALRIYVALYEVASMQGRVEVFDWLDPVDHVDSGHELVPAALAMSGLRHDPQIPASLETAEAAIRLFESRGGRQHRILLFARGSAESSRRNRRGALRAYQETIDVIDQTEGRNGRWINARGLVAMFGKDEEAARRLVVDARRVGQPTCIAHALIVLASTLRSDDPGEGLRLIEEAADLAATVYNRLVGVYVDLTAGGLLAQTADPVAALGYQLRALQSAVALRRHEVIWRSVGEMVMVLRRSNHDAEADELVRPWLAQHPDGESAAARRFGAHTMTSGTEVHASESFEDLLEHTRQVLERFTREAQIDP